MEEGGWFTKEGRGAYGVGLWKDIKKEVVVLKQFSSFTAGDGRRIHFWEDIWCKSKTLCVTFPNIYTMATTKGGLVADFWYSFGEVGVESEVSVLLQ